MKFIDLTVQKKERFSIGIEEQTGKYYLSIPVANSLVDYEEYYEISKNEFDIFNKNISLAKNLVNECRNRQQDHRLLMKPGTDRGVAI